MWAELKEIFKGDDPLKDCAEDFMRMLRLTQTMAETVEPHIQAATLSAETRQEVLRLDGQVNELEEKVRRALVSHLSINPSQIPYCLKLMSLVKDVERLGEYVKNVAEVARLEGGVAPEGPERQQLEALCAAALKLMQGAPQVLAEQDADGAKALIEQGKAALTQSDALQDTVRASQLDAAQASALALLAFFHRRLIAHVMNVVSSVILPVHELDHYDERFADEVAQAK